MDEKFKYLMLPLHTNNDEYLALSDHDIAFGLMLINKSTIGRLKNLWQNAMKAMIHYDFSEVRYLDSSMMIIRERQENSYLQWMADFIQEMADADSYSLHMVELRKSTVDNFRKYVPDISELRFMTAVGMGYITMGVEFLDIETIATDYIDYLQTWSTYPGIDVEHEYLQQGDDENV